ncbi:hypothetical protein [Fluviispira multicolorata]|uniref:Uroporphyrinogen-III synthase n=1 Tax=Fluviispira multicolorata TaxID=2654512 RepID=A0A833JEJ3_9BACT|nr:hypothetical protein [Fluviispira multicolorata]KAB8033241.1 hypothetical protein GCL57_00670 [Fluviispira multicolorata]
MENKNQVIHIECGVLGDVARNSSHFFWPVFQFKILQTNWSPPQNENFSIIFTSKIALNSFYSHVLPKYTCKNFWNNLVSICAVGNNTAELVKKTLPDYFFKQTKEVFSPLQKNGLQPILLRRELFSKCSQVFIFTSQLGKSFQIVDDMKDQCHFQCEVVPLYTLIETNIEFKETSFHTKLQLEKKSNQQLVFYCRSGQILKRVVSLLVQLFNVTEAGKLPSFVFFSTWEQSANELLLELNLIDRKIS